MRVLGRLRCAPEISLGGQVSRVSKAVGPIMHRREKGRLHSGVERDIAESDIVHLPLLSKVARWQSLIPSFPWIAPGWRAWGRNPRKGRDQILQRRVAEP